MLSIALSLVLFIPVSPIDTGASDACLKAASKTTVTDQGLAGPLRAASLNSWDRAGATYIKCAIDEKRVESIIFSDSGTAIALMTNGDSIPFSVAGKDGAWLASYASSNGVGVKPATAPVVPKAEISSKSQGTNLLALLIFWPSVALASAYGIVRYRRSRKSKQRVTVVSSAAVASKSKKDGVPDTRFSDVAGCKEAIEDLQEIVDVLKNPDRYEKIGARTPRGALLVGPPGTGKTLLARAVAGEAGVPFFSAAGSDFVEMYVGVGAKRVRDVFERAKKEEKAIIFIDEIDAIGRRRQERAVSGGEQESENTLIALLNELDGFKGSGVIVLAATNRPDVLDAALCRPGRLDRKVHVGLPDSKEREAILKVHLRNKPLESGINLGAVAARTPGVSGAQLEQICNEAALMAGRDAAEYVTQAHLASAVEYVSMGRARKSASISDHDRKVTAWHEAGHALAALMLSDAQDPVAVSITPRGQAGGVTWMTGSESHLTTRSELRAQLSVALAGRAAEQLLMSGEHTSGAFSDLQQASDIARHMVDRFGMTGRGLLVRAASDGTDSENAAEQLLQEAMSEVSLLLEENASSLEALATRLLEVEDLTGDEVKSLVSAFIPVSSFS